MDNLALLCNLHADGPATLQRLRRLGCESILSLLELEAADLAARLDWNERSAARFLREAGLLSERLDEGGPRSEPESSFRSTGLLEIDEREAWAAPVAEEQTEEELEEEEETEDLETLGELEDAELEEEADELEEAAEFLEEEDELEEEEELEESEPLDPAAELVAPAGQGTAALQEILGAWRELDRVSPPSGALEYVLPSPEAESRPDLSLAEARLEGLDAEGLERLARQGVHTLRGLLALGDLELARRLALGYSRVKHLLFLAARRLERLPVRPISPSAPAPAQAPAPRAEAYPGPLDPAGPERPAPTSFQPYSPPPTQPFETAGPFA